MAPNQQPAVVAVADAKARRAIIMRRTSGNPSAPGLFAVERTREIVGGREVSVHRALLCSLVQLASKFRLLSPGSA
jgi:hypothetical protein